MNIELKKNSGNWILSEGPGISKGAGTLVIRGEGSLEIQSEAVGILSADRENPSSACRLEGGKLAICGLEGGISDHAVELTGSTGSIEASGAADSIGIEAHQLKIEKFSGSLDIRGGLAAVKAEQTEGQTLPEANQREVTIGNSK